MLSIYKIYIYNFYDILSLTCGYTHVNDIYVHVYKHIYIHKYEEVVKQRNTHTISNRHTRHLQRHVHVTCNQIERDLYIIYVYTYQYYHCI